MNEFLIITEIKKMLNSQFPSLRIIDFKDYDYNEIYINIEDTELYHSEKYQELVLNINLDYLWPNKISNVLFICDPEYSYNPVISYNTEKDKNFEVWNCENKYKNNQNKDRSYDDSFLKAA